ncbi:hypothetical protein RVU96_16820 [Bordetella avium]|uniref:hypothetical protein n=1 Tax=Bordetella avium TaxID=521 RepID=UPI000E0BE882|nr:hypothetical protein [Bordetella avium]RIQ11578.1 hypothetical protein D0432_16345 [Bordetella avium]RIQ44923.1 hypothetical protein D0845_17095 [Bordetella avium]RIQ49573.1 hypothetical protein D0844_16390 [Bordetella avium]RIQ55330.1 hypothetical protein D0841_16560 [Bordetella avium]RIQ58418.1 hypothetical protein D0842_16485 [Bordetella avium]
MSRSKKAILEPGAAPTPATTPDANLADQTQSPPEPVTTVGDPAPAPDATDTAAAAPVVAATPVETAQVEPSRPTKTDYASMAAAAIDPTTLIAPVLSRDGWVVPVRSAERG